MTRENILTRSRKRKAMEFVQCGQFPEAKALLEEICRVDRVDAETWRMLGTVCGQLGDADGAIANLCRAVELNPGHAPAHLDLGAALLSADRLEEAVISLRHVIQLNPSDSESLARLGGVLHSLGNLEEAAACYRRALQWQPHWAAMHDNLGGILRSQGLIDESISSHRRAIEIAPNDAWAHSNLLLVTQYLPEPEAVPIFVEHRRWAERHEQTLPRREWENARDPERRLRVGYVSADFRTHSVPFFFEPLLANHNRSTIEPFCYAAVPVPDDVTARLQGLASGWRNIIGLTGMQVAELIRADGIDILVDLAGHTGNNALKVFTYKPAPIQVTWLGYPDTTGLSSMDYRLTDALSDPPGREVFFTESLVRLPGCFLCYQPLAGAPDVAPLPALENGYVTFGSFNHLPKVNAKVLALWAEVLRAVPGSRLFIKSLPLFDDATRERYYGLLEAQGIGRDRVELTGHAATQAEHLNLYRRLDIALDTFPYNGTTTTCEALWMGVPVVTLAGERHSGRVGVSLLNAVGHPEWIAENLEQYIALAAGLAADLPRLTTQRADLRQHMAESSLCDGPSFARKMEAAYREMWRTWARTQG
jgi:predicted O-linked N-acetylglucosamine transferase (SPINDLY family)